MQKLLILIALSTILQQINSSIKHHKKLAFHLLLNESVKKNIKHSVHGNKFVWIPEIKLSTIHIPSKAKSNGALDYQSLSHIFKKPKAKKRNNLKIKPRRLEGQMVRDTYPIKGQLQADDPNLHNLKCQCVFRELPKNPKQLVQKSVKKVKKLRKSLKHLSKRTKKGRKSILRKIKKPSLKSCLLKKKISKERDVLCRYFYSDLFSKLSDGNKRKHRKRRKASKYRRRKVRLNKRKSNEKRLNLLRKLLLKTNKKKHKKSNLVLLEIKN